MLRLLAILACFTLLHSPTQAGVTYDKETKIVSLYGITNSVQWVRLNTILATNEVRGLRMQGPGGDFYSGLSLGRLIHRNKLIVTVPKGTTCASACAYAALGSPLIYTDGKLIIHRGYYKMMPTMITVDEFARLTSSSHHDGTKYLIEMGFTFNFAKSVIADTSPCRFLDLGSTDFIKQLRDNDPFSVKPRLAMKRVNKCNG